MVVEQEDVEGVEEEEEEEVSRSLHYHRIFLQVDMKIMVDGVNMYDIGYVLWYDWRLMVGCNFVV